MVDEPVGLGPQAAETAAVGGGPDVALRILAQRHDILARGGHAQKVLADDPSETTDLAKQQSDRVAELQKRMDEIAKADNDAKVDHQSAKSE